MIRRLQDGEKFHFRIGERNGFHIEFGWRRRAYWICGYFPIQRIFLASAWRLFVAVEFSAKSDDHPQPDIHYIGGVPHVSHPDGSTSPWCLK